MGSTFPNTRVLPRSNGDTADSGCRTRFRPVPLCMLLPGKSHIRLTQEADATPHWTAVGSLEHGGSSVTAQLIGTAASLQPLEPAQHALLSSWLTHVEVAQDRMSKCCGYLRHSCW